MTTVLLCDLLEISGDPKTTLMRYAIRNELVNSIIPLNNEGFDVLVNADAGYPADPAFGGSIVANQKEADELNRELGFLYFSCAPHHSKQWKARRKVRLWSLTEDTQKFWRGADAISIHCGNKDIQDQVMKALKTKSRVDDGRAKFISIPSLPICHPLRLTENMDLPLGEINTITYGANFRAYMRYPSYVDMEGNLRGLALEDQELANAE